MELRSPLSSESITLKSCNDELKVNGLQRMPLNLYLDKFNKSLRFLNCFGRRLLYVIVKSFDGFSLDMPGRKHPNLTLPGTAPVLNLILAQFLLAVP